MKKFGIRAYLLPVCAVSLVGLVAACSSSQPDLPAPDCVKAEDSLVLMRWGTVHADGRVEGHQLASSALLSAFEQADLKAESTSTPVGRLRDSSYCAMLAALRSTFLKEAALYNPGEESRFVELSDPPRHLYLRALWNAKYQTFGSKVFRALYDSLQTLPQAHVEN